MNFKHKNLQSEILNREMNDCANEDIKLKKNYDTTQFRKDLQNLEISLTEKQIEQFLTYYEMLVEWNEVMNLTAITEYDEVMKKHFVDSISLIKAYNYIYYHNYFIYKVLHSPYNTLNSQRAFRLIEDKTDTKKRVMISIKICWRIN